MWAVWDTQWTLQYAIEYFSTWCTAAFVQCLFPVIPSQQRCLIWNWPPVTCTYSLQFALFIQHLVLVFMFYEFQSHLSSYYKQVGTQWISPCNFSCFIPIEVVDVNPKVKKIKNANSKKRLSVERIYQKKSQLEHILLRPDTYIGSVEQVTQVKKYSVWGKDKLS